MSLLTETGAILVIGYLVVQHWFWVALAVLIPAFIYYQRSRIPESPAPRFRPITVEASHRWYLATFWTAFVFIATAIALVCFFAHANSR